MSRTRFLQLLEILKCTAAQPQFTHRTLFSTVWNPRFRSLFLLLVAWWKGFTFLCTGTCEHRPMPPSQAGHICWSWNACWVRQVSERGLEMRGTKSQQSEESPPTSITSEIWTSSAPLCEALCHSASCFHVHWTQQEPRPRSICRWRWH